MKINLEILTPDKILIREEIDEITVPTTSGYITVLPEHVPLLTQVQSGEITIRNNGSVENFAITGGFMEVLENKIKILGDYAVRSKDIEIAKAEEAKRRAERLMNEKVSREDFAIAEAELRRSLLELKVARKRKLTP